MKMRQRPEPTTEDNVETLREIRTKLGEIIQARSQGKILSAEIDFETLMDFICDVIEAKDAANTTPKGVPFD